MTAPAKPEPNVGELATGEDRRDAIHVAVVSMTAKSSLPVGHPVNSEGEPEGTRIGIVDPFLKSSVQPGQRFWCFLYPRTVTSLRHVWTHPAFADESPVAKSDTSESEKWLRAYAKKQNCYDSPEEAYTRLLDGLRSGELYFYGSDLHSFDELDDADELRHHAEAVLGIRINWNEYTFSCSC